MLKDGRKSAGERLVLTMIPYDRPVSLDYDNSHLKTKLSNILLIYYGRDRSIDKYDQRIERAVMVRLPEEDMKIIRADYEKIISYIQDGRADELSEGMTTYLGACTKGATEATMWVDQYYEYFNTDTGEIERRRAKRRAFSLKRSYMTTSSTPMSSVPRALARVSSRPATSPLISKATLPRLSSATMAKPIARLRSSTAWSIRATKRNGRHSFIECSVLKATLPRSSLRPGLTSVLVALIREGTSSRQCPSLRLSLSS